MSFVFPIELILPQLPARAWQPLSAGPGAKGDRVYDWAMIDLPAAGASGHRASGQWWLLVRRHRRTGKRTFRGPATRSAISSRHTCSVHSGHWTGGCTGHPGADATNTTPASATTSDEPENHEDHELRLEY
jgi:hypothetical protein